MRHIRKYLAVFILVVVTVHVVIALLLTFLPDKFSLGHSKVARAYEYLVHLGPFYREESIQSSPHFTVTYRNISRDLIQLHVHEYQTHPWKFAELSIRDFVRRSADAFSASGQRASSAGFRNLRRATTLTFPGITEGDSIRWTYYHQYYLPETGQSTSDTIFNSQFMWDEKD